MAQGIKDLFYHTKFYCYGEAEPQRKIGTYDVSTGVRKHMKRLDDGIYELYGSGRKGLSSVLVTQLDISAAKIRASVNGENQSGIWSRRRWKNILKRKLYQ